MTFPDSPCVCIVVGPCACPRNERALRNISNRTWPHGPMTAEQRAWCVAEANRAGDKREDLERLTNRDLAVSVLQAWMGFAMETVKPKLCESCRACMIEILENRIRRILASRSEEPEESLAEAHCFHLVELRKILEGEHTCGVYDDYGPPATIRGPLFE